MKRLAAGALLCCLLAGCNGFLLFGGNLRPQICSLTLGWEYPPRPDNYGFVVYRADRMEGPYEEVTSEIISTIDPMSGQEPKYSFTDDHVLAGQIYYYSIEAVNTVTRRRTRILPVQPIKAMGQPKSR